MNSVKRIIGLALISCALMACNATPDKTMVENECSDPRPQVCTMIYQPVCGLDNTGGYKTYSSGCNACANHEVVGYNAQACEEMTEKKEP